MLVRAGAREWRTRFLVNAAGLRSDELDRMLGHDGFTVTPRRGELIVFDKLSRPLVSHIVLAGADEDHEGRADRPDRVRQRDARADRRGRRAQGRHQLDGRRPRLPARRGPADHAGAARAGGDGRLRRAARGDRARRTTRCRSTRTRATPASAASARPACRARWRSPSTCAGSLEDAGLALSPRPWRRRSSSRCRTSARRSRGRTPTPSGSPRDPDYGRIVCFCERVTRGEIRDAFASPIPPVDLDGLRRRTRAHMGRCQGFFCGAELASLLEERRDERRGRRRRARRASRRRASSAGSACATSS